MRTNKFLTILGLIFIAVSIILSCTKEDDDVKGSTEAISTIDDANLETRDGFYAPVFYRESVTTDNRPMTNATVLRKQTVFNKSKIDSIFLTKLPLNAVSLYTATGWHWFYKVKIKFIDGTIYNDTYLYPVNIPYYAYKPYGADILPTSNLNKSITISKTSQSNLYYDWLYGKVKTRFAYIVTNYVGAVLITEPYNGTGVNETTYLLPHKQ